MKQLKIRINMVISGRTWTSFYKIQGDSIKDLDVLIYHRDENGKDIYDKEYKRAIKKLTDKNNH